MLDDHSEPTFCEDCGAPVFRTRWVVLNRTRTTTGPYTRLGLRRHPNDIATSVYHQRAEGLSRHFCETSY